MEAGLANRAPDGVPPTAPPATVVPTAAAFPYVVFERVAERDGVILEAYGEGAPLIFVPGMTGGGQATLHLAVRAVENARRAGRPRRLLRVDYTRESHGTLEALQDTVAQLLGAAMGSTPCIVWTESLGNLVAPPGHLERRVSVERRVMLSPFTAIPTWRVALALVALALTPAFLYRALGKPLGRFFFGPAGDAPDHVFFGALGQTAVRDARRRTRWLWRREFTGWFARGAAPTRIWIGARDRLVAPAVERRRFTELTRRAPHLSLAILADAGHVVTDRTLTETIFGEIDSWLAT